MSRSFLTIAALAVGGALIATACSDEDPVDPSTTATTTAIPTATPFAVEPTPIIVGGIAGSEPTPPGGTGAELSYVIEPGDALETIAQRFGVTVEAIMELNGLEDAATIFAGQELLIPAGGSAPPEPTSAPTEPTAEPTEEPTEEPGATPEPTVEPTEGPAPTSTPPAGGEVYVVQDGDSGLAIANAFGITLEALAEANGMTVADLDFLQIGQEIVIPAPE